MKKDKLYLLTFLAIAIVFFLIAFLAANFFIKSSTNQLIKNQIESSKREANQVAELLNFQINLGIEKEKVIGNLQTILENSENDSWYLTAFNWSGKEIANPDKTKVGQIINADQTLLNLIKENNTDLYHVLLANHDTETEKIVHIAPVKNSDFIIAANANTNNINTQIRNLKVEFYLIFLVMGVLVVVLSFLCVRYLGSLYEKHLEQKNSNLALEVVNLSKLNTDLVSYQQKLAENLEENTEENLKEIEKKRILTYVRNELISVTTDDIAYVFTENTITYVVSFDGKRSITNLSLDDMFTNLNSSLFFRANRQYIISINAIDKILKYGKSQLKIVLQTKTEDDIIISKNKAAEFKQWLNM